MKREDFQGNTPFPNWSLDYALSTITLLLRHCTLLVSRFHPTEVACLYLGLWEAGDRPLLEQLQTALQERHLLFFLDTFEQVIPAALQLANLLAACPYMTSQEALRLSGEYEFEVSPLSVPDLKQLPDSQRLAQIASVCLFLERARAMQTDFAFTPSNTHAVAEVCVRLDGLLLAIELAEARIKLLPPQALLKQLSHRLSVLTGGARDMLASQ